MKIGRALKAGFKSILDPLTTSTLATVSDRSGQHGGVRLLDCTILQPNRSGVGLEVRSTRVLRCSRFSGQTALSQKDVRLPNVAVFATAIGPSTSS
jgi:hypothetical protein